MAQTKTPTSTKPVRFAQTRTFYRIFEIIPGLTTWCILLGPIILSFFVPIGVAYFIIAFDIIGFIYFDIKIFLRYLHFVHSCENIKMGSNNI